MFAHTHLVLLSVTTLICVSLLHDALARPHVAHAAIAPVQRDAPQDGQRHLITATVFRAAAVGY
jgi:hypothetical protein